MPGGPFCQIRAHLYGENLQNGQQMMIVTEGLCLYKKTLYKDLDPMGLSVPATWLYMYVTIISTPLDQSKPSCLLSCVVRKPDFCICENKDADQLHGNRESDRRLCFRYMDSMIPLLLKYGISSL